MKNDLPVMHAFNIVRESVITYHLHQLSKFLRFTFFLSNKTKTEEPGLMINASTLQVSNIDLILEKQHMQPNKQIFRDNYYKY